MSNAEKSTPKTSPLLATASAEPITPVIPAKVVTQGAPAMVSEPVTSSPKAAPAKPFPAKPLPAKAVPARPVAEKPAATKSAAKPDAGSQTPGSLLEPLAALQENLRATTQKSLDDFRSRYASLKQSADTASDKMEESFQAAQAGTRAINARLFDLVRTQSDASLKHVQALFGARTLHEALDLQKRFIETQIDALQAQSKDFAVLAQKVASTVVEPVKDGVVVAFRQQGGAR